MLLAMNRITWNLASAISVSMLMLGCAKKSDTPTGPATALSSSSEPPKVPLPNPTTIATTATPPPTAHPTLSDVEATRLAAASNAFAVDLWRALSAKPGNLAISPASISTALAMTWGGSRGNTSAEMSKALHLEGDVAAVFSAYGSLSASLQDPARQLKLRIANRLFGEQSFKFEQPFIDQTAKAFAAPLQPMDFKGSADAQRNTINTWVDTQTEHRIKDLLPPRSITEVTRLVLVNAIYFLADWAEPFDPILTSPGPFSLTPSRQKNVPMMHQRATLRLSTGGGATVLELPYRGNDAAMWIVLPTAINGLPAVEAGLSAASLTTWQAGFKPQPIVVTLPKFTINPPASLALAGALKKLGINDAFNDASADFSAIGVPADPKNRLFISDVFHKAFVAVDEKGTEAAAATAVVMAEGTGRPVPTPEFVADHPFLFMIVDKRSGMLLFMGRVTDPQ